MRHLSRTDNEKAETSSFHVDTRQEEIGRFLAETKEFYRERMEYYVFYIAISVQRCY